jgi:hypothetical protein
MGRIQHINVYLFNRTSPTCLGDKTFYEIWYGTKPIVSHYQVFGYFVYVFINKQMHSNLDAKSTKLVFLGYNITTKGYRFLDPKTKKVKENADVIFDETSLYNNFIPKPAHFIELLQVGTKQALTLTRVAQPHTIGKVGAT